MMVKYWEAEPDWVLKPVSQLNSFGTLGKFYTLPEHRYFYLLNYSMNGDCNCNQYNNNEYPQDLESVVLFSKCH